MANEKVIEIAKKYVGVTEYPPNSNNVIFNTKFYGREVSGANYPWCCAFIWCVFNEAGINIKRTASCMMLGDWFKQEGKYHKDNPQVGDIVFFKFSGSSRWTNHVGLVIEVNGNTLTTIEGNTSSDNKGSQNNGGMVAIRTRKINSSVVGFGRVSDDKNNSEKIFKFPGSSMCTNHVGLVTEVSRVSDDKNYSAKNMPTLRLGSRGASVKTLQGILNEHGAHLTVDGIFGNLTKLAVISFQGLNDLQKDGIVGRKTWEKLL